MTGATAARAAALFARSAMGTLATSASFHAALCGGEPLLDMLAALRALPGFRRIDWRHVHVFAVDDGWDDAAMAALATCPLPPMQLHHPRRADIARVDAARRYGHAIGAHFGLAAGSLPAFDFVLLDVSRDGRVAGFSHERAAASEVARLAVAHPRGTPRVALALPVLNAARVVALVCGPGDDTGGASLLDPRGELHVLAPSTARSIVPATPATARAARTALPPS